MNEINNIIDQYEILKSSGTTSVLATVVHVEGSSYRREGARMLIDEYGYMTGAISGGCLEGDALKKALLALYKNQILLTTYDTTNEDDAKLGAQLGCNGIIDVLFEPIDYTDKNNPIEILQWAESNEDGSVVIVHYSKISPNQGTINAFSPTYGFKNHDGIPSTLSLDKDIKQNTYFSDNTNQTTYFFNYLKPKNHLIIVGAGNDGIIMTNLAQNLGWKVTVVDGRHTHATKERFGDSCQIYLGNAEEVISIVKFPKYTAIALMSHNFQYDLIAMSKLINFTDLPYIGLLGPKKKFEKMKEHLHKMEIYTINVDHIFAPMGFDIGAETPSEIALSTLAEMTSVLNQKSGVSLKFKNSRIHEDIKG
jgi:xanthine/CO dehydrogenase XdhC/CoxF family maturation factor